jgi:hypothetical protein
MRESEDTEDSACYRIKVRGKIDNKWTSWFEGMKITYQENDTVFTGLVVDQSALHGLLNKIRDLNLQLVLVERIESNKIEN